MVEFDRTAFIGKFQEEASEYLQRLNEGVIALEQDPGDEELIQQMLRDAHTLKGSSRMVGLMEISDIAHKLEDIMVHVREKDFVYTMGMSDLFFEALDAIVFLSEHAGKEEAAQLDAEDLVERLSGLARAEDDRQAAATLGAEPGEASPGAEPGEASPGAEPGEASPGSDAEDDAQAEDADEDDEGGAEGGEDDEGPVRAKRDGTLKAKTQPTIRIRTSQLDSLLNLVSEVVIAQIKSEGRVGESRRLQTAAADLRQRWLQLKSGVGEMVEDHDRLERLMEEMNLIEGELEDLRGALIVFAKDYTDDIARAATVISDLQEESMRLRMLPVGTVFQGFPRAVRDLARDFHKEVDFVMEGEQTELDKKVLEEINDPLIHIIRNAIDHGIEPPVEREAEGKPRAGTIRMEARQEGDHIVIEISDDGRGIDPDKVREAAVRKGYLTEAEARGMSDREAVFQIFESGFSTAPIITEISGRGVGMDVVRQFVVDKLKGSLNVDSRSGEGTTFTLTIPLTLAIIRALVCRVGDQTFAIPTSSIEETLRVAPEDVTKVEGRQIIRRQRRNIPLVRMGDVIGVEHDASAPEKLPVVVIGFSGHRLGFVTDAFRGEQQIVIKSLGSHLKHVENVAGVTVLGAGDVVVILNVPDLMQNARRLGAMRVRRAVGEMVEEPGREARRILICEDSFTTRELERSIFEAAGYDVETAMDGRAGLNMLKEGLDVDIVVTDVQMPNMTGFELTRAVKQDELLRETPVVIVTSLEREEEKAEGIEAGADAYITKSVFNQDTLLDTVERLIR